LSDILITGGTGFVGNHLITHLNDGNSRIAVLSSGGSSARVPGVDYYEADIRDANVVRSIVHEVSPEKIFHLAGISDVASSWKDPRLTFEVNVLGTLDLFEAAMSLPRPPRILNVSTAQVYAPAASLLTEESPIAPDNPYAASKAMAELLMVTYSNCAAGGIVTARAFNHTGPGQSDKFVLPSVARQFAEIQAGLRPPKLIVGNVEVQRDFTDVRDVVRAYSLLLEKGTGGDTYNVCSGSAVRLLEIIQMFESASGIKVELEKDPARIRPHEAAIVCGSRKKIEVDTGWRPQIPLKQTVSNLLEYWRSTVTSEQTQEPTIER
jgi:GDP-4-dehydro-6-deoxy-D-mannose reductase